MSEIHSADTARLNAEETSEFFEHALIGMARVSPSGHLTQVNRALCDMLGYSHDELLERTFSDVTHPDDIARSQDYVRSVIEGKANHFSFEKRYIRKDGSTLCALLTTQLIRNEQGEPGYFLTQIMDTGDRRRRQEIQDAHAQVLEMVAMEAPLSAVLDKIVRCAERLNPDMRASVLLLSPEEGILRHGAAPSLPDTYNDIIDGLAIGVGVGSCGTSAATGQRVVVEDVCSHPYWAPYQELAEIGDFRACWSEPILDPDGTVLGTFAMYYREPRAPGPADLEFTKATARLAGIGITRRRAEAALSQSEENLRITLDSIADAVIATDAKGLITRLNPVAEQLTGWTSTQARRRLVSDVFRIVHADTREPLEDPVQRILRGGEVVGLAKDAVLLARDGATRKIADSGAPIRDRDGEVVGVVLVFRDISEEYELQEQHRQAQKMEAIGQLAGGVAHDFNNLLSAILGSAELLTLTLREETPEAALTSQIIQASKRASELTKHLLAFSRKGTMQTVAVDLHSLIDEVVLLLSRIIDKRIEIAVDLGAESSFILGDPSQLQNALLNLGVNARDAMPTGGDLRIRTRNRHLSEEYCASQNHPLTPGCHVELSLSDTGIGMSRETQKRIFEPFFTTKEQGHGTGLGLAGVYGTVRSHSGQIRVDSDLNRGATFRMLFPVAQAGTAPRPAVVSAPVSGQGRILVVDDEELVRNFAATALERFGYTVTTCADGVEAAELFATRSADFDLVILDMMMPKLSGLDTFRRLKQLCPDVRVLVSSGFSHDQTVDTLMGEGALGFLAKPFLLEELSREVARACGASK